MADRLALIIEGMCKAVACCGGVRPIGISGLPVQSVAGELLVLIWSRLRRISARFARHLGIRQAAAVSPVRSRPQAVPQAVIARSAATKQSRGRPHSASPPLSGPSLPRHKAWLLRLVPETAAGASQLRHFLNDPEVAALLAEAPQLGRILRPLCFALGIRPAHVPSLYPQPLWPTPPQPPDAPPIPRHPPALSPEIPPSPDIPPSGPAPRIPELPTQKLCILA